VIPVGRSDPTGLRLILLILNYLFEFGYYD
jgi:hypothetical protein